MTNDTDLLQQLIAESDNTTLLLLDENSSQLPLEHCKAQLISNRFDIAHKNERIIFNDFDFSATTHPINTVIFRIAKEKAINLHVIHSALQLIQNGEIILLGYKNDGMKSLIGHIKKLGEYTIDTKKHARQLQEVHIRIEQPQLVIATDYSKLQRINTQNGSFISKPGLFGWQKVDIGSQLLVEELEKSALIDEKTDVLDLGCGYGFLSIQAHKLGAKSIDATDNSAAALLACKENFRSLSINGTVTASNAGNTINKQYQLILCNPPFHQGFDHKKSMTEAFVEQASRLCKKQGHAVFVVNEFIGIEKIAQKYFKHQQLLSKSLGFKVLCLSK